MPTLTALRSSARRPGRVDVHVEGEPNYSVDADVVLRLGLEKGRELDDEALRALRAEAEGLKTYDRALALLARRAHSRVELMQKLTRKGDPGPVVARAVERLASAGLVDDAAFARSLARQRLTSGGRASRRVVTELLQRGVDRDLARDAVAEVVRDEAIAPSDTIGQLAERKLRTLAGLPAETRKRRLYGFLARRGFDSDEIGRVVRRLVD